MKSNGGNMNSGKTHFQKFITFKFRGTATTALIAGNPIHPSSSLSGGSPHASGILSPADDLYLG